MAKDPKVGSLARELFVRSYGFKYSYNFRWMGLSIIQYPEDMIAVQELIWDVKPDLIIETGIAHGGSLVFYASLLDFLGGDGMVLGIDVEIRAHNRRAIEAHPMNKRIRMIEGSSIAPEIVGAVAAEAERRQRVFVCLDSNHTHDHVLQELRSYAPLASLGSYVVVFDTVVEEMPANAFPDRPWGPGNNPKTAVREFLRTDPRFSIDAKVGNKLLLTAAPDGYLKRVGA